jgi:hypothetical protein
MVPAERDQTADLAAQGRELSESRGAVVVVVVMYGLGEAARARLNTDGRACDGAWHTTRQQKSSEADGWLCMAKACMRLMDAVEDGERPEERGELARCLAAQAFINELTGQFGCGGCSRQQ